MINKKNNRNIEEDIKESVLINKNESINKNKYIKENNKRLFGTDGIRNKANQYPLEPSFIVRIGKAIGIYLRKHYDNDKRRLRVIIGKDTRISGYMIENALTSGLISVGVDVLLVGPMPTPAISYLTKSFIAESSIVISASHNPYEDNGIKIFDNRGIKLTDIQEQEIESYIFNDEIQNKYLVEPLNIGKAKRIDDAIGRYIEFVKSSVNNIDLSNFKLVVDCSNGASYKIANYIFNELRANALIINNKPNGLNINENCGSEHPETLREFVIENNADYGIAFDGDADRLLMIDSKGDVIDGDILIGLAALGLKQNNKLKKNTIVVTNISNLGLDESLLEYDIKTIRCDVGDKYVVNTIIKNNLNFGGEQSGHMIFFDIASTGDGIVSALQILKMIKENKLDINKIKDKIKLYPQVKINLKVKEKKELDHFKEFYDYINEIEEELKNKQGRILIRYSGTQNLLRILVEHKSKTKAQEILDSLKLKALKYDNFTE